MPRSPNINEAARMKVIISPAKNMVVDADTLPPAGMPAFLPDAEYLACLLYTSFQGRWFLVPARLSGAFFKKGPCYILSAQTASCKGPLQMKQCLRPCLQTKAQPHQAPVSYTHLSSSCICRLSAQREDPGADLGRYGFQKRLDSC